MLQKTSLVKNHWPSLAFACAYHRGKRERNWSKQVLLGVANEQHLGPGPTELLQGLGLYSRAQRGPQSAAG